MLEVKVSPGGEKQSVRGSCLLIYLHLHGPASSLRVFRCPLKQTKKPPKQNKRKKQKKKRKEKKKGKRPSETFPAKFSLSPPVSRHTSAPLSRSPCSTKSYIGRLTVSPRPAEPRKGTGGPGPGRPCRLSAPAERSAAPAAPAPSLPGCGGPGVPVPEGATLK